MGSGGLEAASKSLGLGEGFGDKKEEDVEEETEEGDVVGC